MNEFSTKKVVKQLLVEKHNWGPETLLKGQEKHLFFSLSQNVKSVSILYTTVIETNF